MVKSQHREDRTVRDLSDVLESINKF